MEPDCADAGGALSIRTYTLTQSTHSHDHHQIVVPLSGGYDSRLVLAGLVAAGYRDLVTFTYGQPGSGEVRVSQRTAAALGVPWHGVAYTPAKWRAWRRSADAQRLRADARRYFTRELVPKHHVDEAAPVHVGHDHERAVRGAARVGRVGVALPVPLGNLI